MTPDPTQPGPQERPEPSEEELRAALEEQMRRLRVEDVLLTAVSDLLNLGVRRTGAAPGTEGEADLAQARVAIDAVRALATVLESATPDQAGAVRDALAQVQMAYVRQGGAAGRGEGAPDAEGAPDVEDERATGGPGATEGGPEAEGAPADRPAPEREPGPAQRSGRLWVPGD